MLESKQRLYKVYFKVLILNEGINNGSKKNEWIIDSSDGTLLDDLDSLLGDGLVEGLVKTPTLVTVTVTGESFYSILNHLKRNGFQFTGIIKMPLINDRQEIKYFFTVKRDMEILIAFSIFLENSSDIKTITGVYPSAGYFEDRIAKQE